MTVVEVMSFEYECGEAHELLSAALARMRAGSLRMLPVLDHRNEIVGFLQLDVATQMEPWNPSSESDMEAS